MSAGTQLLSPALPLGFNGSGGLSLDSSLAAVRPETRLELGLGLHWLSLPAFVTVVLMPWVTLNREGFSRVSCVDCAPFELDRVDGSWGFSLAVSSGVVLGPEP